MIITFIDFETYYDEECSVSTLGPQGYARHPRFHPYMVSIVNTEGEEWVGDPKDFDWTSIEGTWWASHNKGFDEAVHQWLIDQGLVPDYHPECWIDTAALAAYIGVPRDLAGAVKALYQQPDEKGELVPVVLDKGLRTWAKGKTPEEIKAKGKWEAMCSYCLGDSRWGLRIAEDYLFTWPENERWLADHTVVMGAYGMAVNAPLLQQSIVKIKNVMADALAGIPWADTDKPLSPKALGRKCLEVGIPPPVTLSEDDNRCEAWETEYGEQYPWVASMRQYRKANIILRRLEKINRHTEGGRYRFHYSSKYFGAHTGRWAGDGGFNMQNQQRDESFGVNQRNIFVAGPGKKLIICDLSQIEPRVLYWLAEDWDMLDKIRAGFSVYAAHAIQTMGWDPARPFTVEESPKIYKTAKARVLGLGYQCGWKKFIDAARILAQLVVTPAESKRTVSEFRATNGKIVRLWNKLDAAFKRAVRDEFQLELPSGRVLTYFNVQRRGERFLAQSTLGKPHADFYGGKLTENATQAAARDVFVEGLRRIEDAGHPVVMHSHDELVCEVDRCVPKEEVEGLMTICPEWLEGCPIGAKAIESDFYLK